ncbi:MAG: response regulator [Phycisphaerae bacterium]|nr:MAG: response regulator [Planctomycetota bacterium]MBE7458181.1 response regulator [Planctomycetia bacterium]MCL4720269.1 response regulator [Phycisphaerae bacterium]
MSYKALIIDDDPGIVEEVSDIVESLGHTSDSAVCMHSTRQRLDAGRYDYVLLDLEIPVRAGRNIARIQNGMNLLKEMRQRNPAPIIVMTGHRNDSPDQAVDAMRAGATDYIAKPFNRSKRPFDEIIRSVLSTNGAAPKAGVTIQRKFDGGELIYYPDRIELLGETIAERSERGNFCAVLERLREKHPDGRLKPARANDLVRLFKGGRARQNTVSSCIGALRDRITCILGRRGIACGPDDVIVSGGPGYRLSEWIIVRNGCGDIAGTSGRDIAGTCGDTDVSDVPAPDDDVPASPANVPLNDRQHWVLDQLRQGVQLERAHLEKHFGIGSKTAKRDLSDLTDRGLIEFVRTPRPGHYRIVKR